MPSQDAKRAARAERGLSRRSLLQGAATAGAAGLAVSAFGAATAGPALAASSSASADSASASASASASRDVAGHSDPIVVHVRNARSGDIEVFSGTSSTRLRDKDLAARIARAAG
jgi:nitrous oxide reductase